MAWPALVRLTLVADDQIAERKKQEGRANGDHHEVDHSARVATGVVPDAQPFRPPTTTADWG